ncbi:hypothetical protein [Candidatus Enterovibrio escicola]|nr:hypothetical protein [Candidatus Enterovibrio escacola]
MTRLVLRIKVFGISKLGKMYAIIEGHMVTSLSRIVSGHVVFLSVELDWFIEHASTSTHIKKFFV